MSRVFSMTIRIRLAMMLRAATMTISVMVRNMMFFSSFRAEKRVRLSSIQVVTYRLAGRMPRRLSAWRPAWKMSSIMIWRCVTRSSRR